MAAGGTLAHGLGRVFAFVSKPGAVERGAVVGALISSPRVAEALYQPFPMAGAARGPIWRYAPRYRGARHFHGEPELNLVLAGSGIFGADAFRPLGV